MKKKLLNLSMVVAVALTTFLGSQLNAQNYLINEDFESFPSTITSVPYNGWQSTTTTGDSTWDKWVFDNYLGYSVSAPMEGKVGLVDCYNAGNVGSGSNGGRVQDVSLSTPTVSTAGLNNLYLSYDYRFMDLNTAVIRVEVSTNGGTSWTQVWSSTTGSFFSQFNQINLSSYTGNASFKVRFRWDQGSTATTHGYWMLDNVKLFSRYTDDVGVEEVDLPLNNSCPSAKQPMQVTVTNFGTNTATNISVNLVVTGGTSNSFSTTISSLNAGASTTVFTSDSINTTAGGNYNLTASVSMSGDLTTSNDTLAVTRATAPTPTDPSGPAIVQCGVGKVTLQCSAQSGEETVWYEDSVTNTALGDGNPYTTQNEVYASRRFYAENTRNLSQHYTNFPTGVYRYNTNSTKAEFFDVTTLNEVILDSFATNWAYDGTYIIDVYYKTGTYQNAITNQGAWTLLGTDTVVTNKFLDIQWINPKNSFRIGEGESYGFAITSRAAPGSNSGIPAFAFKLGTSNVTNEDMNVYSNNVSETAFTNLLTGYSADIEIGYRKVCKSQREGIDVVIVPRPTGVEAAEGMPFNGFHNQGSQADPDYSRINDTLTYELTPPTGYSNADFGTGWFITDLSFQTANGTAPISGDTMTTAPGASANATLRFTPTDYVDSVFVLRATILDVAKNCDTTITRYIIIAAEPHADFKVVSACEGDQMNFDNESMISSGSQTYKWYFGDGDSSNLVNPVHTYPMAGTYDVTLIATSDFGFTARFDSTITVYENPDADFIVDNACEGEDLQFTDASILPTGSPNFTWSFGDGSNPSNAQNPSHQYNTPGSYVVSLLVEVNGCTDQVSKYATQAPRAVPSFTAQTACNNRNVDFTNGTTLSDGVYGSTWDYGDGTIGTGNSPRHDYSGFGTFDVKLVVTTNLGCMDSVTNQITVVEAPSPDFTLSNACSNEAITVTNLTNIPAGGANNYQWTTNTGLSSTADNPILTFNAPGTYTIKLVADNSNGCSDSITRTVVIDTKPIAGFNAEDVCEGEEVDFSNVTVNTPNGVNYIWDFGNGATSMATDTSILYTNAQAYTVNLYAITTNGCADTAIRTVNVNELPDATFIANSGFKGDGTMSFSGPNGSGYNYQWFMGDGTKYSSRDLDHRYNLDGNYEVRLVITTDAGCVSESKQIVNVYRTGLKSDEGEVSVYPNPSAGRFTIDLSGLQADAASYRVTDMNGKLVKSAQIKNMTSETLDLSEVAAGTYLLSIQTDGQLITYKLNVVK